VRCAVEQFVMSTGTWSSKVDSSPWPAAQGTQRGSMRDWVRMTSLTTSLRVRRHVEEWTAPRGWCASRSNGVRSSWADTAEKSRADASAALGAALLFPDALEACP